MAGHSAELMRVLHAEHAPALWLFSLRLTDGDRARAEDLVRETLLRAWRWPEILSAADARDSDSVRGWLFTLARNAAIDQVRSEKRPVESELTHPTEPDGTELTLQSMMVADALRKLSEEHRSVLLECYFRGNTASQAAVRLDVPVGTVKSRLHYALRALRLSLQEMGMMQ